MQYYVSISITFILINKESGREEDKRRMGEGRICLEVNLFFRHIILYFIYIFGF